MKRWGKRKTYRSLITCHRDNVLSTHLCPTPTRLSIYFTCVIYSDIQPVHIALPDRCGYGGTKAETVQRRYPSACEHSLPWKLRMSKVSEDLQVVSRPPQAFEVRVR